MTARWTGDPTVDMGMLGFFLVGLLTGAVAGLVRPAADRFGLLMVGGFSGLFGGVLSATARHGALVPFFSARSWLVALVAAALGVGVLLAIVRRSG